LLTCKVGETIINSFDGTYDKHKLKQWSDKNLLKCPVCNGNYEYCHGEVVSPYFRHKDKDCTGYYSESETDEHKKGKIALFNWIKNKDDVSNCKLEAWIPETKQRPDIYFEYKKERFVIEFQCTPIATEYLKRRELYKLAGIKDIWVLGVDKYQIHINKKGDPFHGKRYKTIENELKNTGLLYFDVLKGILLCDQSFILIDEYLKHLINNTIYDSKINKFDLFNRYYHKENYYFIEMIDNFTFEGNKFKLNNQINDLFEILKSHYSIESQRVDEEKRIAQEKIKKMQEKASLLKEKINEVENTSSYVGIIGEKIMINVILAEEMYFRTYNSSLYKFIDDEGNILTWMTSTCPDIQIGDYFEISGKVKSHSEYDDSKQTRLIRCQIGIKV
jgi:hypothetical protein